MCSCPAFQSGLFFAHRSTRFNFPLHTDARVLFLPIANAKTKINSPWFWCFSTLSDFYGERTRKTGWADYTVNTGSRQYRHKIVKPYWPWGRLPDSGLFFTFKGEKNAWLGDFGFIGVLYSHSYHAVHDRRFFFLARLKLQLLKRRPGTPLTTCKSPGGFRPGLGIGAGLSRLSAINPRWSMRSDITPRPRLSVFPDCLSHRGTHSTPSW